MINRGAEAKSKLLIDLFLVGLIVTGLSTFFWNARTASAQYLTNRSVQLSTHAPSVSATDAFEFNIPTASLLGSIVFEYCDNSPIFSVACNAPAGLDVNSANLSAQSGSNGFAIDNSDTTANKLVISRVAAAGLIAASSYNFDNITNPSAIGTTIFIRISTHASTDGSGAINDSGAVAFVTETAVNVAVIVPPFLRICVGLTVAANCSSVAGDNLDLGDLSTAHASAGQSQFTIGTNSPTGYTVFALGTTMTSGNNTIPSLAIPAHSLINTGQFGINLRQNTNPQVGQEPFGIGNGSPTANYGTQNLFLFNTGDTVASSDLPSEYNRMTVSYLVNIDHSQPVGIYSTTITYLAVAQF